MLNLLGKALEAEEAFGLVLRDLRQSKRLSQEKLAFDAGLDRNYISLIELGKSSPSLKTVFKLCSTLNISASEFFSRVEGKVSDRPELGEA